MDTNPTPTGPAGTSPRPLVRPQSGRLVAGVCAGVADYLHLDPLLIRLAMVLLTVLGGSGLAIYLAAWLLIPEQGAHESIAERALGRSRR